MTKKPFLIFDAGGVLVFPDFQMLADIANQVGIDTSPTEIAEQHARLFRAFDEHVAQHHQFPAIQYFQDIFKRITASEEKVLAAMDRTLQVDKTKHIWATTQSLVGESLRKLKEAGYQMAVISNSDGRVDQILQDLDLRKYFETVTDSFVVGVEKPDPRIFEITLEYVGWDAAQTIYIGDLYYVDVWGANQAGLGAVHLDKMGLYDDWDGIHIRNISELPGLLSIMNGNLPKWDLFPAQDFRIRF